MPDYSYECETEEHVCYAQNDQTTSSFNNIRFQKLKQKHTAREDKGNHGKINKAKFHHSLPLGML